MAVALSASLECSMRSQNQITLLALFSVAALITCLPCGFLRSIRSMSHCVIAANTGMFSLRILLVTEDATYCFAWM